MKTCEVKKNAGGAYYSVTDFGAVGDGVTNDQKAIQSAIDVCHANGGGTVLFEKGVYKSGGLYLKSNVFLEIGHAASLEAYGDISCYGADAHHNRYRNEHDLDRCWIYAEDAENIGIRGYGKLDGHAELFPNEGSIYRPMMFRFLRCRNIHISDVRLYNAASWTTAFLDSEFIWVRGVDIRNEKRYNGDGLDFDGCRKVYISDCNIRGTDDNLCLQAGNKAYPVEDIHITNCSFSSICAAIRIGLKSIGSISNVVISNCTMRNVWREGIKIECTEGGSITDIAVRGCTMHNVTRPVFVILNNRFDPEDLGNSIELEEMPEIGTMGNLLFESLILTDDDEMKQVHKRFDNDLMGSPAFHGIRFDAEDAHPIDTVFLKNIMYTGIGGVKKDQIPEEYPKVLDKKKYPDAVVSENYYPTWSRAAFMDLRNVKNLLIEDVVLRKKEADERENVILERCELLKTAEIFECR